MLAWVRELLRIIIVDDEPNSLQITKEIMLDQDKEMEIKISSSPSEALKWVKDHAPDCVISDYKMPEMNGIEFTRSLRESTQIPVILYTNLSEDKVIQEAFEAGVSDYVLKENDAIHYTLLMRRMKNAIDKYRLEMQVAKDILEVKNGNY